MHDLAPRRARGKIAFIAFLVSLFVMFTPFEKSGLNPSMFPKYFSAGFSMLALAPLFAITRVRIRVETQMALVVLSMVVFHSMMVVPCHSISPG